MCKKQVKIEKVALLLAAAIVGGGGAGPLAGGVYIVPNGAELTVTGSTIFMSTTGNANRYAWRITRPLRWYLRVLSLI